MSLFTSLARVTVDTGKPDRHGCDVVKEPVHGIDVNSGRPTRIAWPHKSHRRRTSEKQGGDRSRVGFLGISPRTLETIAAFACVLGACAGENSETAIAQCRLELAKLPRVGQMGNNERFSFIHTCMQSKGWKADETCVKTEVQGTAMCQYKRQ